MTIKRLPMKTIFIHPGANHCRIYLIGYPMRPGQRPSDLLQKYKDEWEEVGMLNHSLEVVYLSPSVAHLKEELTGQMGGTWFHLDEEFKTL